MNEIVLSEFWTVLRNGLKGERNENKFKCVGFILLCV